MNVHSPSIPGTPVATPTAAGVRNRLSTLSLAEASTIATFALVAMLAVRPTSDPDKFWHLATGRWIWKNHRIPKTDPFSWTKPGRSWVAHEWLTEAVWFRIYQAAGWAGLAILTAVIILAALRLTHRTITANGGSTLSANVLIVFASLASIMTWGIRPQMLSFALVALVCFWTTTAWHGSGTNDALRRRLWFIVPVMLVWANAHGAYIFGIAVLGAFATGLTGDLLLGRLLSKYREARAVPVSYANVRLTKTAWQVTVASIVVTLINPHGVAGLIYPFTYLGDNASTRYVGEWFAPRFNESQFWPFAILLALSVYALVRQWKRIPLYAFIQMAALGFLGVQSIRNITPFSVVALPWIAMSLKRRKPPRKIRQSPKGASYVHLIAAFAMIVTAAVMSVPSMASSAITQNDSKNYPSDGVEWIRANPRSHLLNQYEWGGYLTWFASETPVAVDGRPDMYGDAFMDRFVSVWYAKDGWQNVLDTDGYDRVFGSPGAAIVKRLRSTPGWTVRYEDKQSVVLDRIDPVLTKY
jgi:hypothetical protein